MADFFIMSLLSLKCQSILACVSYEKFKVKLRRSHCFKDRPILVRAQKRIVASTVTDVSEYNRFLLHLLTYILQKRIFPLSETL